LVVYLKKISFILCIKRVVVTKVFSRNNPVNTTESSETKVVIPLVEYVQNVMKLIEAILSNNSTDDHAR